jgi:hypothetical protein
VESEKNMLWTILVILLILWLLGFSFHVACGLVHLLLVLAVVVLIFNLLTGRRGVLRSKQSLKRAGMPRHAPALRSRIACGGH